MIGDRQRQDDSRNTREDAEFPQPPDAELDEEIDEEAGEKGREKAKPEDGEEPKEHQRLRHKVGPARTRGGHIPGRSTLRGRIHDAGPYPLRLP